MQVGVGRRSAARDEQRALDAAGLQVEARDIQRRGLRVARPPYGDRVRRGRGDLVGLAVITRHQAADAVVVVVRTLDVGPQVDRPVTVGAAADVDPGHLRAAETCRGRIRGAGRIDDVIRPVAQAPVVGHAHVGLDHVQCQAADFLQARDGLRGPIGGAALVVDGDGAEHQEQAEHHGDHELDEADARFIPGALTHDLQRRHLRSPLGADR